MKPRLEKRLEKVKRGWMKKKKSFELKQTTSANLLDG